MKIEELMTTDVRTCRASDPLSAAVQMMWDGDCGAVVVCDDERRVIGMVTDRDACMAGHLRGAPLWALTVGDAMAKVVYAVGANGKLATAVDLMKKHQVRRLPVVDESGRLSGLLTLGGLAQIAAGKGKAKKKGAIAAREVGEILSAVTAPRGSNVLARTVIEVHRNATPEPKPAAKAVLKPKARAKKPLARA
jgi:CBS domain-containing protein